MELTVPYYLQYLDNKFLYVNNVTIIYNIWTINFYKETINHYRHTYTKYYLSYKHIFGVYLQFVKYLVYILHDYYFVYRILVDV